MKIISAALLACLVLLAPGMLLAQSHSGTITMTFDLSAHPDTDTTRLWIPYPVSDENQMITDITVQGDSTDSAVYTAGNIKHRFSMPAGIRGAIREN